MAADEDDKTDAPDGSEAKGQAAPKRTRPPVTIDLEARVLEQRGNDAAAGAAPPSDATRAGGRTSSGGAVPPSGKPTQGIRQTRSPVFALAGAGIVGGLVALVIGYGVLASGLIAGPDRDAVLRAGQSAAALEARAAALEKRLATVEDNTVARDAAKQISGLAEQQKTGDAARASLTGRMDQLDAAATALKGKVDALATTPLAIEALGKRIDAMVQAGTAGATMPAAIGDRVTKLETSLAVLSGRLDAVTDQMSTLSSRPARDRQTAEALAIAALGKAAQEGGGFAGPYGLVQSLIPSNPDVLALQAFAEKGAPSRAELAAAFPAVADAVLAASQAGDGSGSFWQGLLRNAEGLVSVRPAGPVEGSSPEAVLSRMRAAIDAGDLVKALAEREALPASAKEVSAGFATAAGDRIAIDRIIESLSRRDAAADRVQ